MSRAMTAIAGSAPAVPPPRWASETATSSGVPSARHQTVVCSPEASPAAAPREPGDRLVAQVERHHRQHESDRLLLGVSEHAVRGRAPPADATLRIDFADGGFQHKPPGSILDR